MYILHIASFKKNFWKNAMTADKIAFVVIYPTKNEIDETRKNRGQWKNEKIKDKFF